MKTGTESKLKFKQLKRRLKLPLWQAIGLLETLWRATEANTPEGDIGRLTDEEIASALEWEGDASELVAALIDCRWIDPDEEFRLIIHDWSVHCPNHLKGALAKHKREFADLAAKQRAKQNTGQPARQAAGHHATNPNQSNPNQSNPSLTTSCAETAVPSSPPTAEALLVFPCDGEPEEWQLSQFQVTQWSDLYPSLDVLGECRSALAWVLADGTRRKTARGMARFLVGWLGRSQNRGARGKTSAPLSAPPKLAEFGL
jgi:hypothetical protein